MRYINYRRTWNITSLPKCWLSSWEIWCSFLPRNHCSIRGFSPWNGERFLSLGQCGEPLWEGGGGIVWLAAWKLVSNDAKRTIPPPNAKHSTLPQGCFFYVFVFDSIHDSATMHHLSPHIFYWTRIADWGLSTKRGTAHAPFLFFLCKSWKELLIS